MKGKLKRISSIALASLCLGLCACGGAADNSEGNSITITPKPTPTVITNETYQSYWMKQHDYKTMPITAFNGMPITLWPFPKAPMLKAAEKVHTFISVEMSMGQMIEDIELAIRCRRPVKLCNRVGGMIPSPDQVYASIVETAKEGGAQ